MSTLDTYDFEIKTWATLTEITASIQQIATLNKMLPKEFRFELVEQVHKNILAPSTDRLRKKRKVMKDGGNDWTTTSGGYNNSVGGKEDFICTAPRKKTNNGSQQYSQSGNSFSGNKPKRSQRDKTPTSFKDLGYQDKDNDSNTKQKFFKSATEVYKKCEKLVTALKKHTSSQPFMYPVDTEEYPNYLETIKEPMDLSTVDQKLKEGAYENTYELGVDVRKIWKNAFQYNPAGSPVYLMAQTLSQYFEEIFKDIDNQQLLESKAEFMELDNKLKTIPKQLTRLHKRAGVYTNTAKESYKKVVRKGVPLPLKSVGAAEKRMSLQEQKELIARIKKLPKIHLRGLVDIVKKDESSKCKEEPGQTLEIDLKKLSPSTTREIARYVKQCQAKSKNIKPVINGSSTQKVKEETTNNGNSRKETTGDNKLLKKPSQFSKNKTKSASSEPTTQNSSGAISKSTPEKDLINMHALPTSRTDLQQQTFSADRQLNFSSQSSSDSDSSDSEDYNFQPSSLLSKSSVGSSKPEQTVIQDKPILASHSQQPSFGMNLTSSQQYQQQYGVAMIQNQQPQMVMNPFQAQTQAQFGYQIYQQPLPPQENQTQQSAPNIQNLWAAYKQDQQQKQTKAQDDPPEVNASQINIIQSNAFCQQRGYNDQQ